MDGNGRWAQLRGLPRIEVASFADPRTIPQSADAGELFAQLPHKELYSVLVPNLRGRRSWFAYCGLAFAIGSCATCCTTNGSNNP